MDSEAKTTRTTTKKPRVVLEIEFMMDCYYCSVLLILYFVEDDYEMIRTSRSSQMRLVMLNRYFVDEISLWVVLS